MVKIRPFLSNCDTKCSMKVAIIGSGPLAIEMALYLDSQQSTVVLFMKEQLGGSIKKMASLYPDLELDSSTSEWGRELLGEVGPISTIGEYWNNYLKPLSEHQVVRDFTRLGEVLRVHKRFLGTHEKVDSRLSDLFRVVFTTNPSEDIIKQVKENPETFEKMGENFIESLKESIEFFEDFDLVVDCRGVINNPMPMGPGGSFALNEKNLKEFISYGVDGLKAIKKFNDNEVFIVGSGKTSALFMLTLKNWLAENSSRRIFLVTDEKKAFSKFFEESSSLSKDLKQMLGQDQEKFDQDAKVFGEKINEWKSLEDFVRAKVARPVEPERKIAIFEGHNVTSVDKLLDKNKIFITLESPEFRGESLIKTIGVDLVLVSTGYKIDTSIFEGMQTNFDLSNKHAENDGVHSEPGFYTLGPILKERYGIKEGLDQVAAISKNMFSYFTWKGE